MIWFSSIDGGQGLEESLPHHFRPACVVANDSLSPGSSGNRCSLWEKSLGENGYGTEGSYQSQFKDESRLYLGWGCSSNVMWYWLLCLPRRKGSSHREEKAYDCQSSEDCGHDETRQGYTGICSYHGKTNSPTISLCIQCSHSHPAEDNSHTEEALGRRS